VTITGGTVLTIAGIALLVKAKALAIGALASASARRRTGKRAVSYIENAAQGCHLAFLKPNSSKMAYFQTVFN
jgi:hypothetical protein